jgi:PPM family protein phosphatase
LLSGHCLRAVQLSDVRRQREINEDSFGLLDLVESNANAVSLYVVADGMGGHVAGEVASRVAVETILSVFEESIHWADMAERLRSAFERANAEVHVTGNTDHQLAGMGTTVVAAVVSDTGLTLANVGDSRAYLLRDGKLDQLTRDHSWVARAVEDGVLTPAQARSHPDRNVIYRNLGSNPVVEVDTFTSGLLAGDRVLLCSDGLTDVVEDDYLVNLAGEDDPDLAVQHMIDAANEAGGPDNITVTMIVVDVFDAGAAEDWPAPDQTTVVDLAETPAADERPTEPQSPLLGEEADASAPDVASVIPVGKIRNWLRRIFRSRS